MALIVKCRGCRRRVPAEIGACPSCGSADFRFIVDFWPRGRNGGRRQITLPAEIRTQEQALSIERDFLRARTPRNAARKANPAATVADLFSDYLDWYRLHRAPSTYHDVAGTWERDLRKVFGANDVAEITGAHYSLYQKIRGGRVSNRTVNKELNYFSGFLRWCRKDRKLDIARVDYDELPCSRPLPIVLSPEEVARILAAAESEPLYHALFLCLYTLGLRMNEARNLKREDFDFDNMAVRVKQKGGTWKILPINAQVAAAVKRWMSAREEKLARGWKIGPHVFSARKDGDQVQNIRRAIARICGRAEVVKKVNPHLFRHSIATHLLGADVNLRTIQRYLGHSSSSTTEFYTHVALGHLRNAQDTVLQKKP